MTPERMKEIELDAWGKDWQLQFEELQEYIQQLEAENKRLKEKVGEGG